MQAYTEAFQPSDDVALIVHSSYGDHFWERELQDAMSNSSQPAVLFFQVSATSCSPGSIGTHFSLCSSSQRLQPSTLFDACLQCLANVRSTHVRQRGSSLSHGVNEAAADL